MIINVTFSFYLTVMARFDRNRLLNSIHQNIPLGFGS